MLYRANGIADAEHLPAELAYLRKVLAYNQFSKKEIDQFMVNGK